MPDPGSALVSPIGWDQYNVFPRKLLIDRITDVGMIPYNSSGSSHGKGSSKGRLGKGKLLWRSIYRAHREWTAKRMCTRPKRRSFTPLAPSHCPPSFFFLGRFRPSSIPSGGSVLDRPSRGLAELLGSRAARKQCR